MKKTYLLLVLLFLSAFGLKAQTTISSLWSSFPGSYTYGYSQSNLPVAVTFNVINTNSYPIYLTKVGYAIYAGYGWGKLYHSSTSISGNGGVSSPPTWILDAERTGNSSTWSSTIDDNFFTNICIMIPANTTYRFCMVMEYNITLGIGSPAQNTSSGVILDCGDPNATRWGHHTNLSGTGYGFIGSITFTSCESLSGLVASNVKSSSADLTWGASGSSYEYSLTTTATPGATISTSTNSISVSGLAPSTTYYLNVRKVCSASDKSCWATTTFTTLPPCTIPVNLTMNSLAPGSVDFSWDPVGTAISYDYVVDQQSGPPSATGVTNTLLTQGNAAPLNEGTKYYIHLRTNCSGEQTEWGLDSFTTPIPCRAPVVGTDYVNATEAVAFWDEVKTATQYEYAVTKSSTPPALGTLIKMRSLLMPALLDGVQYYVHVRSHCESEGILGVSPWTSVGFKTFPLGINTINGEGLGLEVYPNPAQNVLNLKLLGTVQSNATITLVDISGRMLKQMQLTQNEMTMDISGIAPGVYQLRYKDDANSKTIKVVKE